jgi:peptide/nickel transport system substrate-binding protein
MIQGRLLLLLALVILSVIFAPGCKKKKVGPKNSVTIGLEGSFGSLDPRYSIDAYSVRIGALIYSGLVKLDKNANVIGDLALSWENPDDRTYIFKLKQGVKFHSGAPLTAKDVKFTFESIANPENKSPKMSDFQKIDEIVLIDDFTVKIVLKEPFAPFLISCTTGIVPQGSLNGKNEPTGSGPYRIIEKRIGDSVKLAANTIFFGETPKIPELLFKVIPEGSTRVLEIEAGSLDLLQNSIPIDSVPLVESNDDINVIHAPGIAYSYLGFNLEDDILVRTEVRQAIAHAIDRDEIIKYLLGGFAVPASGILAPSNWAYEGDVAQYAYNPQRARQLLDEAGLIDPDGGGPQMRFELLYKTSQNKDRVRIAERIAAQLKEVGIGVTVRAYEWATFFGDIRKGNFQIYSLTWVGIVEPDIYFNTFHRSMFPPVGANRNRYSNPELDPLLEQGRTTVDRAQRIKIYSEIQKIVARELPYVSLWYNSDVVAVRKGLQGFEIMPGGNYASLANAHLQP